MEIPASVFFGSWAFIGVGALLLGFDALNKTTLPASVSPPVLFLFKNFLVVAASHSSTYTLAFPPKLKIHVVYYHALLSVTVFPTVVASIAGEPPAARNSYLISYFVVHGFVLPLCIFPLRKCVFRYELHYVANGLLLVVTQAMPNMYTWFGFIVVVPAINFLLIKCFDNVVVEGKKIQQHLHFMAMLLLLTSDSTKKPVSLILVLSTTFLICIAHAAISLGDKLFQRSRIFSVMKRNGDVVEFSMAMVGTILFQYFIKLTSFDHVVVFLYFTVAWLANLAILLCRHDAGVFIFFLTNVIVGSAVSEFGLGRITWVAYGASLLLFIIRRKLLLLCVVYRDNEQAVVSWRQNQTNEEIV